MFKVNCKVLYCMCFLKYFFCKASITSEIHILTFLGILCLTHVYVNMTINFITSSPIDQDLYKQSRPRGYGYYEKC